MHKLLILGITAGLLAGCTSSKQATMNGESSNTATAGWQTLSEGNEINGWHTYGSTGVGKAWRMENGVIHFDPAVKKSEGNAAGGDLVTNEAYDNFQLSLDWKISQNGNSGIIFYVQDDPSKFNATYLTGLEMQVVDNNGHPDGKIFKHKAGDLYDLVPSSKEAQKPVGEWNHVEMTSKDGKLDFRLNGEHIVSTTLWDENFNKMVAGSKFKDWKDFAKAKKGHIALQDHGDAVWFRNIKIRKL